MKLEDTHIFSSSFFLTGYYAENNGGFSSCPQGGLERTRRERLARRELRSATTRSCSTSRCGRGAAQRRRSYLLHTGGLNHELKFGFAYRRATTNSSSLIPGNGIEARIETARGKIARIQRELVSEFKGDYTSLYLQDTFTSGRLTLTGGARWDLQKAENAASTAHANPLFPEILPDLVYDGAGTKVSWSDISPRVGFTYALDDARKTLLRGNFSIFTQQLAHPDVTVVNPIGGVAAAWITAGSTGTATT